MFTSLLHRVLVVRLFSNESGDLVHLLRGFVHILVFFRTQNVSKKYNHKFNSNHIFRFEEISNFVNLLTHGVTSAVSELNSNDCKSEVNTQKTILSDVLSEFLVSKPYQRPKKTKIEEIHVRFSEIQKAFLLL